MHSILLAIYSSIGDDYDKDKDQREHSVPNYDKQPSDSLLSSPNESVSTYANNLKIYTVTHTLLILE